MFNFLKRNQVKEGLTKTRESFKTKLANLIFLDNDITEDFWTGLEDTLIAADVGAETTAELVDRLRERAARERIVNPRKAEAALKEEMLNILQEAQPPSPPRTSSRSEDNVSAQISG